ncbi:MAG: polyprenol monophosphomannose synthase [Planctomycetota bacterium]
MQALSEAVVERSGALAESAVSAHVSQSEQPKRKTLSSIILATYNERENIRDTIRGVIEQVPGEVEVIVVDDDSPDETWRIAAELDDARVKIIRRVATRGLASAFNRGIIESRGEIVGWMDADMSMPPSLLPLMIGKLATHDVVIASRYAEGGLDDRHWLRAMASRCINRFAGLVLGYGIRDYDSGFVVLRRSVFDKVSIIPTGYGAYFMEFLYTCRRKGLTVTEVPYVFRDRTKGVSKSAPSLWRFFWTGMGYVTRILMARMRRID